MMTASLPVYIAIRVFIFGLIISVLLTIYWVLDVDKIVMVYGVWAFTVLYPPVIYGTDKFAMRKGWLKPGFYVSVKVGEK